MAETFTICVDNREQRPPVEHFSDAVRVEYVTLGTGDYSLQGFTDLVLVERKAPGDLWGCCGAGRERFESELARMRDWPLRAVVVESTIDQILMTPPRGKIKPATVIRSTIAWQQDYSVPFVWAGSPQNAAAWIERFLTRVARKGKAA